MLLWDGQTLDSMKGLSTTTIEGRDWNGIQVGKGFEPLFIRYLTISSAGERIAALPPYQCLNEVMIV